MAPDGARIDRRFGARPIGEFPCVDMRGKPRSKFPIVCAPLLFGRFRQTTIGKEKCLLGQFNLARNGFIQFCLFVEGIKKSFRVRICGPINPIRGDNKGPASEKKKEASRRQRVVGEAVFQDTEDCREHQRSNQDAEPDDLQSPRIPSKAVVDQFLKEDMMFLFISCALNQDPSRRFVSRCACFHLPKRLPSRPDVHIWRR
jgi:hypothetical protein